MAHPSTLNLGFPIFKSDLLSQMNEHRGNDLIMFNEVMKCVKAHATHYNMDYTMLQILSSWMLLF
jgi:hypothetical protein